jgi:glycosyltransferase involved in cell wall biosynthesis
VADFGPGATSAGSDLSVLLVDPSDRGGLARYTERLADALRREGTIVYRAGPEGLGDAGFELSGRRWGPEIEALGRARLYALRLRELIPAVTSLRRAVVRGSPDIIHCQAQVVPGVDHLVITGLRRCAAVVLTVHDPESMMGGPQVLPDDVRRWQRADAIVVHSEQARMLVARHVPAAPVSVVPVDLNLSAGVMPRAEARRHLGLGTGPIALLLGFLRPYKGLALLASAWPAVAEANPEARLMLVGEPYSTDELNRLSALDGVELRSGFLPDEEIDVWAAAADVLVMPYDRGSHSGVLHRAVAAGTPVLASPPLAQEVQATGAGRVVALETSAWSNAIYGALGPDPVPPPKPPADGRSTARGTIEVYKEVMDRRAGVLNRSE